MLGKELVIRFTVRVLLEHLSIFVLCPFCFGFECGMWDLIILIPDHCLFVYFVHLLSDFVNDSTITEKLLQSFL